MKWPKSPEDFVSLWEAGRLAGMETANYLAGYIFEHPEAESTVFNAICSSGDPRSKELAEDVAAFVKMTRDAAPGRE